jgi:hypothetical protein
MYPQQYDEKLSPPEQKDQNLLHPMLDLQLPRKKIMPLIHDILIRLDGKDFAFYPLSINVIKP